MRRDRTVLLAVTLAGALCTTPALAAHLDVLAYVDSGGGLTIDGYDFEALDPFVETRTFEGELSDRFEPGQFYGDAPGFYGVPNALAAILPPGSSALPASVAVTLNIELEPLLGNRSMSFWNGVGPVKLGPVPGDEILEIVRFGSVSVLDGSNTISGFPIGATSPVGSLHEHLDFLLKGDDSGAPDDVTEGVYVVRGSVSVGDVGFPDPSSPLYMVFGTFTDLNEAFMEEAVGATAAYLEARIIPEPSTALLLGLGLLGLGASSRRPRC